MSGKELQKYFYSNIASVFWSAFLLLGGGVFITYYARIGYMPDFDLKSSVTITAATAVTALVITLILLGMMVLPGSFWGGMWKFLGSSSKLKCFWTVNDSKENFLRLLVWFATPLFSVYLGVVFYLYTSEWYWLLIPFAVSFLFFIYLAIHIEFSFLEIFKEWLFLNVATLVAAFLFFLPLSLVVKLSAEELTYIKYWPLLSGALVSLFLVLINIASASNGKDSVHYFKEFVLGASALFMVFFVFGKFDIIPFSVMSIYKFGNVEASELVLKKEGCELYESLGLETSTNGYDICIVKDVLILSRLGKESYLEVEKDGKASLRFTMPTSFILSWTIERTVDNASD